MLRSLYSGVSGLRGFQTKLDVIGNNIANVNTVGFKAGRVMFQDILSQTVAGATEPEAETGGTNPRQIGLGTTVGSIDTLHTPGSPMTTNVPTDVAINGEGFFVVTDGNQNYLTRAGNFYIDGNRNLVTSDGLSVLDNGGGAINLGGGNLEIEQVAIGSDGTITVKFDDGSTSSVGPIGLARIENPAGLDKVGNSLYVLTPNADPDGINPVQPGTGGTGELAVGFLEMSNVDLTSEFTEMIVAQRAFQANSRIITTSDEVLQELVNLKR